MTILERLRKRSGLLVAIVGFALFAFVLTGLFESRSSLFGGSKNVGEIAGKEISIQDYETEYAKAMEDAKLRSGQSSLDEQTMENLRDQAWETMIRAQVLNPQIKKAGVAVTDQELQDMIIGRDPDAMVRQSFTDMQTGKVNPMVADTVTGEISGARIKAYVDQIQGNPEMQQYFAEWKKFEDRLREGRLSAKYYNLIKKGLNITTAQAKADYEANNTNVKFKYVLKRYASVLDTTIQVTDADIQKYYNENQNKYKQDESRKLEYVVFDVLPSQEDVETIDTEMRRLTAEFKAAENDSLFVVREAETKSYIPTFVSKKQLPYGVDSTIFEAEKGTVYGPYRDGKGLKAAKLVAIKMVPDSGSARHILISYKGAAMAGPEVTATKEQAKALADSILNVLKKQGARNFPELVTKYSSDKGSVEKGGEYKWFKDGQMVPAFQNAVFDGKKGDLVIAETQFGYHVMEVLDKGKEQKKVQIAFIDRAIEPGSKTRQEMYDKASDFAIKYKTPELFEKGIKELNLSKRVADPLKATDKTIAGLDSPKEIIRWAFNNDKGTISTEPFSATNKYVVALIADIREKGIAPLAQKREEIIVAAKQEKKAQLFTEEFNKALGGSSNIEVVAGKLAIPAQTVESINFAAYAIPSLGPEPALLGSVCALKQGELSKPIKGVQGVYIALAEAITKAPEQKDLKSLPAVKQQKQQLEFRVDNEVYNALKEKAEIKDERIKFY